MRVTRGAVGRVWGGALAGLLCLFMSVLLGGCGSGGGNMATAPGNPSSGVGTVAVPTPTTTVHRHPAELQAIRDAIASQGAQWIADDTSVSESFEDVQDSRVLNGDIEEPEPRAALSSRAQVARAPFTSFSWRNRDGKDWCTTPKDQGKYGTCVSFASIGALELQIKIARGDAGLGVDLSEWCLWSEGTSKANPDPGGWSESKAATWLRDHGTVATTDCPYTPELFASFTSPLDTVKRHKISSYSWVSGATAMKAALVNGPLVGSMMVYPDFDLFYKGGIYEHVVTRDPRIDTYTVPSGSATGTHHAILVIGYDDVNGCWVCKNSSGPYWGEAGFCRIKYGGIDEGGYQYAVD